MASMKSTRADRRYEMRGIAAFGGCIAFIACMVFAVPAGGAEQAASAQAADQERENPLAGKTTLHKTVEDILREEARYSPQLRQLRAKYRRLLTVTEDEVRARSMTALAEEAGRLLPDQADEEAPVWLRLQQDAYVSAGRLEEAKSVLDRRFGLLSRELEDDGPSQKAFDEAVQATALRRFELADLLYDKAIELAHTRAMRFRLVMERGRLVFDESGMEAAVGYYLSLTNEYLDEDPELAREAHFRAAETYYRNGELDEAILVIYDIEAAYPGTPEAEKARHARKGWVKQPGEE